MGRILVRGERGHDLIPALAPIAGEPVIDKPGKGAFFATDLQAILTNRGIENLIVGGVTTEVCVHTTVREANDRGYRCIVAGDCCGSYFPEFHEVGLRMIKAQGGIFGWVSDSKRILSALAANGRTCMTTATTTPVQAEDLGAGRLERVLRVRHQHPRQPDGADDAAALRDQDARPHRVRAHPARDRADALPVTMYYAWLAYRLAQEDRAHGRLRAALGHQRAAHVRRHLRDHAADRAQDRRSDAGLGGGLTWVFIQSFVLMGGGFIAPFIRKVTPRAALLGTLAGVSITFISMRPAAQMFMTPVIGVVCFAIILASWFGGVKVQRRPAGLVAIAVGSAIAWSASAAGLGWGGMGVDKLAASVSNFGFSLPLPGLRPHLPRLQVPGRHPDHRHPVRHLRPGRGDRQRRERGGRGRQLPDDARVDRDGVGQPDRLHDGQPVHQRRLHRHPGWKSMGGRIGYSAATGSW
jgi:hypothetical protein